MISDGARGVARAHGDGGTHAELQNKVLAEARMYYELKRENKKLRF